MTLHPGPTPRGDIVDDWRGCNDMPRVTVTPDPLENEYRMSAKARADEALGIVEYYARLPVGFVMHETSIAQLRRAYELMLAQEVYRQGKL